MGEFEIKQERLRELMERRNVQALLLRRVSSFAWATCGAASYINTAASDGVASLLVTRSGRHLITNNIELPRLDQEEGVLAQGWEVHAPRWHAADDTLANLTKGLGLGADGPAPGAVDLSADVASLRAALLPEEGERIRRLSQQCAEAMQAAARAVRPGQTEYQMAAVLAQQTESRGVQVIVNLIATDERIFNYRHPLPTAKVLARYAMLILCGRRWGLVCSVTRLVHFGRLPDELRRKADATAHVDAAFIEATRPGRSLGEVFAHGVEAYAKQGFPDEWHLHHQGGPAGYEPREVIATPAATDAVLAGQAYAWNPSITGTKSEDTVLVGASTNEVLTSMPGWPTIPVEGDGRMLERPAILEAL